MPLNIRISALYESFIIVVVVVVVVVIIIIIILKVLGSSHLVTDLPKRGRWLKLRLKLASV